jgi:excisionase family DNA binding protein
MSKSISIPVDELAGIKKTLNEVNQKVGEQLTLQKSYLNTKEASRYLNLSQSTLYKLTANKLIKFYKPRGKKIYFKREWLDLWIASNDDHGKLRLNKEDQLAKEWTELNYKTKQSC